MPYGDFMEEKFTPNLRFLVLSDIHLDDGPCVESERSEKAITKAYELAQKSESYKNLDALVVVGDFATSGSEIQMKKFKAILDKTINLKKTKVILSIASHEYHCEGGVEVATKRFKNIFGCEPDNHVVINGYHFVSISPSSSCDFDENKQAWMKNELASAVKNAGRKQPIFVFQHPHVTNTVYGSIYWGDDALIPAYMNYPQIVDFSGHSHAPVNDPRSVYQNHFSCFGTGTLSYFELDEFDKDTGTKPEHDENAAQMLIVEADKNNRVRVYPYDLITDNFFPYVWKIDVPSDPSTFLYTDKRYKTDVKPYFDNNTNVKIKDISSDSCKIEFDQAKIDEDYVDFYDLIVKDNIGIVKQQSKWSGYYFYNMPNTIEFNIAALSPDTDYTYEITACGFWHNYSETKLKGSFKTTK